MESARVVRAFEGDKRAISLMAGSPGPETLRDCKDILLKATSYMLDQDTDSSHTFTYGPDMGDLEFRQQLAHFLTQQYGDPVDSHRLMATAGATQALHLISTILFHSSAVVFMEDPTYFAAYSMLKRDFNMDIVSVPCDEDGMDTDVLDRLLTAHSPKVEEKKRHFWAMVYTIPVYHNPTGRCYSPSRCRRLVELARKHNVLLMAEDVYNLIHFGESYPPPRLLTYDNPSDPDYGGGHTLSSGTFSKVLAPGLRLGWVEGPERILNLLHGSFFAWSGGSPNHYASRLAAAAMKLGLQTEHLTRVRRVYKVKQRRDAVCRVLRDNLPQGATFTEPQGGFFVWIEFPEGTDTFELVKWMMHKYHIFFLPGICSSAEGKFGHCARVSFCFHPENVLVEAMTTLCKGAKEYIDQGCK